MRAGVTRFLGSQLLRQPHARGQNVKDCPDARTLRSTEKSASFHSELENLDDVRVDGEYAQQVLGCLLLRRNGLTQRQDERREDSLYLLDMPRIRLFKICRYPQHLGQDSNIFDLDHFRDNFRH